MCGASISDKSCVKQIFQKLLEALLSAAQAGLLTDYSKIETILRTKNGTGTSINHSIDRFLWSSEQ